MSDILEILPEFDLKPYRHLTYSFEKNGVTVYDLITYDAIEIAKRCPLPLNDLRKLIRGVITALQQDAGKDSTTRPAASGTQVPNATSGFCEMMFAEPASKIRGMVKTLDPVIDACLGGGFRTSYITEIVGESAVGKTQFVLGLLLSCQLPPPQGLGKSAIYVSTEAPLNTTRLLQMLASNPLYQQLPEEQRPSLDRVHTISTNNLETQDHVVQFQLPIAVQRFNVGLVVMDSVAANFRAEHTTHTTKGLADRAVELLRLGSALRKMAREADLAVVVTNQVSDRFDDARMLQDRTQFSSPPVESSPTTNLMPPPPLPSSRISRDDPLSLDYQQQFFTGWGQQSMPSKQQQQLKTPALGLAWANQLSARVVLKMESRRATQQNQGSSSSEIGGNIWKDEKKKRFVGVVFAPWVAPTCTPVEYEIQGQGVVFVPEPPPDPHADLLDPSLWFDGAGDEEEEFP